MLREVKFGVDDVLEVNARMAGYHALELAFCNGMMGADLDLEIAQQLAQVITEVVNKEDRRDFEYERIVRD